VKPPESDLAATSSIQPGGAPPSSPYEAPAVQTLGTLDDLTAGGGGSFPDGGGGNSSLG
jgi:hypothetical protein